jgi:hypothetical protein
MKITRYGPWAVITGASDGIGKEMATLLAESGLNLVLVARRQHVLDDLATDLTARFAVDVRVIAADLSTPEAVESLISATSGLDVGLLVAAAGYGTSGRFIELPVAAETAMLDLNCRAVVALSHHFGRRFAAQGHGGIILFSSLVAFQGVPLSANYAATKAYIQSLAEGLYHELAPLGVDVLASAPGPIRSGFAERADMRMSVALQPNVVARATLRALGRKANVRPGLLSKLLIGSLGVLPRPLRVRAMRQIMGGMTAHQRRADVMPEVS